MALFSPLQVLTAAQQLSFLIFTAEFTLKEIRLDRALTTFVWKLTETPGDQEIATARNTQ